jgi:hypothetical protein
MFENDQQAADRSRRLRTWHANLSPVLRWLLDGAVLIGVVTLLWLEFRDFLQFIGVL